MAGLAAGNKLVQAWQNEYTSDHCPDFNITFEKNSWDSASARVCGSSLIYDAVDLAGMSGSFFPSQAGTIDGWSYQCHRSTLQRETTVVLAAYRGVVVGVSKGGAAEHCIALLGGGLSKDQLRWIYSAYNFKTLLSYGWDPLSVPFMDEDDNTHLWSELHENCTDEEIVLAVEEAGDGNADAMDYIHEHIVRSPGETIRDHFSNATSLEELRGYMEANGGAISIFHLYDTLSKEFQSRDIIPVGIKNKDDEPIMPSSMNFESELYPFLKKITIGLVKDDTALKSTRPFFEFGYSTSGTRVLKQLGYWPIEEWKRHSMFCRLGSDLGISIKGIQEYCHVTSDDTDLAIHISGGNTVLPIIRVWKDLFTSGCPMDVGLEGGRSSDGARLVCSSVDSGEHVDVGMMSRDFNPDTEAAPREKTPFVYDCLGDRSSSAIQIEVGIDGITIVLAIGSEGEECVRHLGGLTMDQLRWMYSSYNDTELENSGWDPSCLSNNDFNTSTHLWSELDRRCADKEIQLVGDKRGEGIFTGFLEMVLLDFANGETVADKRPSPYVEAYGADALQYLLLGHEGAVAFGGYHFYTGHEDVFWAVPVAHQAIGPFVEPSETSIGDQTYPISRPMFLAVRNHADVLKKIIPFVKFGYDHAELIRSTGYAPLGESRAKAMILRLNNGPYTETGTGENEEKQSNVGLIVGILFACFVVIALVIVGIKCFSS